MDKETECRKIYREAFGETDTFFENLLFENCGEYCRTFITDAKVSSMLFALPCRIFSDEIQFEAFYIFAAATKSEFRKKGHMSRLLEALKPGKKVLFLRPANNRLIEFYKNCGFSAFPASNTRISECRAIPLGGFKTLTENINADNSEKFTAMYFYNRHLTLENLYFPFTME